MNFQELCWVKKKPVPKGCILYGPVLCNILELAKLQTLRTEQDCQGGEWGRMLQGQQEGWVVDVYVSCHPWLGSDSEFRMYLPEELGALCGYRSSVRSLQFSQ